MHPEANIKKFSEALKVLSSDPDLQIIHRQKIKHSILDNKPGNMINVYDVLQEGGYIWTGTQWEFDDQATEPLEPILWDKCPNCASYDTVRIDTVVTEPVIWIIECHNCGNQFERIIEPPEQRPDDDQVDPDPPLDVIWTEA